MIVYKLSQKNPASHYVYIDLIIDKVSGDQLELQLPAWRPGRYELGNFAKNIKRVDAFNEKGEAIPFTKHSKDLWVLDTRGCSLVKVTYSYYSAELNAGACFADTKQVYMNPVHCCMQVKGRENEQHAIELNVPDHYQIAASMEVDGKTLIASNYEELVDSPFFAASSMISDHYEVNGIRFHLHFVGECRPDLEKFKKDFSAFTQTSIQFWGDFPVKEYHFLFQVLPNKFYHGVEHQKNTVIAIGPGYAINNGATYEDVLGVSCHELFHTWNIKYIRPAEMLPYDYTKENYARTGYVYEGFTTYYGDKLLLGSGVFNAKQYLETLKERLVKHFHNYGRYNLSVAQSSWETWLDGYVPGAPYRKTNIYDEGNLIAFMLDVMIMRDTNNERSLREVCRLLYERFGKKNIGYHEQDIISLVNEVSGKDYTPFFNDHVYGNTDFEPGLRSCFEYLGIEFVKANSANVCEDLFGFKITENGPFAKVTLVAPYSPSWKSGLFAGDEIIAVNDTIIRNNFHQWLQYFSGSEEIRLTVNSADQLKTLVLQKDRKGNTWFFDPVIKMKDESGENYLKWRSC